MKIKKHTTSELTQLFKEGMDIDNSTFADFRRNSLLYNGKHFGKNAKTFDRNFDKLVKGKDSSGIKVNENHINKIVKAIANSIKMQAPDVTVRPKNMEETGDQKRAEIHRSILEDWKKLSDFKDYEMKMILEWIIFGEIYTKTFWDPASGRKLPDITYTELEFDLSGENEDDLEKVLKDGIEIKVKRQARFEGDVLVEKIYPFDLIRDPQAETFKKAKWVCVKKLVCKKKLSNLYKKDKEKLEAINKSSGDIYDCYRVDGQYVKTGNQVLVREFYFRPSYQYPNGYYFILAGNSTDAITLHDGDLPAGIFPIDQLGFDEVSTSPRFCSIIEQLKSNQHQINLMKSKVVEHVLKLGDDSVFMQSGSKLSQPNKVGGLKIHTYTGQLPTVIQGRVGAQYIEPIQQNIQTMYTNAGLPEILETKDRQLDAHTALYTSAKQKARFSNYVDKYERFLKKVFYKVLKLKKIYLPEDAVIMIAGKDQQVNIPEFKTSTDLGYEICMEGQSEDAETKLGRSLDLQKILQYGAQFGPEQIGVLIKSMPYINNDEISKSFTKDYTNLRNDICRLERGDESVLNVRKYENHDAMIEGLICRTKEPDFEFLPENIKQLFEAKIQIHEQVKAEQIQQARAIEADFIPTGGALLNTDFYITDGLTSRGEPKTRRLKIPAEALNWLYNRLQQQGLQKEIMDSLPLGAQADVANQIAGLEQAPVDDLGLDGNLAALL